MHFYKEKGKPRLNAGGNLILSKNEKVFTTRSSSAGPRHMDNLNYVMLKGLSTWGKFRASVAALKWIWGNDV